MRRHCPDEVLSKSVPGRRNSMCKGLEAGMLLAPVGGSLGWNVPSEAGEQWRTVRQESS